jgi:hypothetical protein
VFFHPTFGIPDDNDAVDWVPFRDFFGLPEGETSTLSNASPENVLFDGHDVKWGGVLIYLTPCIEFLPVSQIDGGGISVALSGVVNNTDIALIIQNGNKFLINTNLVSIEASFILSRLISGRMNGPTAADVVIASDKALIFAEYDSEIDIDLPWAGATHMTRYDPQGSVVLERDTVLAGAYFTSLTRGDLVILVDDTTSVCGDADTSGEVDIDDVVYLINYIFADGPAPHPVESGDADCSGDVDIDDVVYLIAYIFSGGNAPCDIDGDEVPDC